MALVFPMWLKRSGEYDGSDQGLERRHSWAAVVRHREAEGMSPHGMDEFTVQRAATGFAQAPGLLSECADRVTELVRRRIRWQWRAERYRQRIGNSLRPFPQETPAFKAEDAAPQAIQVHGDDRHFSSLPNPFEPSTERQQCTGASDLPFREDADDLSVVECLPRAAQRPEDHAGAACRRNRDDLHGGHQPFEQWVARIGGIDNETYGPIDAGHEQEAIDERHMVRDEQGPAGLGNMVLADDAETVEGVRQDDEHEPQEHIRHQPESPQRAAYGHSGSDEENAAGRKADIGE